MLEVARDSKNQNLLASCLFHTKEKTDLLSSLFLDWPIKVAQHLSYTGCGTVIIDKVFHFYE